MYHKNRVFSKKNIKRSGRSNLDDLSSKIFEWLILSKAILNEPNNKIFMINLAKKNNRSKSGVNRRNMNNV